jgi:hypothetical protein
MPSYLLLYQILTARWAVPNRVRLMFAEMAERHLLGRHREGERIMADPEEKPSEEVEEEIEVVAHSEDEDEELTAGCYYNGSHSL